MIGIGIQVHENEYNHISKGTSWTPPKKRLFLIFCVARIWVGTIT